MKKPFPIILLVAVFFTLVFCQCSQAVQQKTETLTIGVTLALSGPASGTGILQKKAIEALSEDFNKAGGLVIKGQRYNINTIIEDDKYSAEGGRAAYEKLITRDKVTIIINTIGAAPVMAGIDIAEPSKVLMLVQTSDPRVLEPQYHYVYSCVPLRMNYPVQWGWIAKNQPQIKKICLLAWDDITGHNDVAMHSNCIQAFGLKAPEALYYPRSITDWAPVAAKVKQLNPDMVAGSGMLPGGQQGTVWKALYQAGWRGVTNNGVGIGLAENLEIAGKEPLENWMGPITDGSGLKSVPASLTKLIQVYEAKYAAGSWNKDRMATNIMWLSSWYFLVDALKKANRLDTTEIAAAMQNLQVETPSGLRKLIVPPQRKDNSRTVEVVGQVFFGQIKDGKINHVGTVTIDEAMNYIKTVYK